MNLGLKERKLFKELRMNKHDQALQTILELSKIVKITFTFENGLILKVKDEIKACDLERLKVAVKDLGAKQVDELIKRGV